MFGFLRFIRAVFGIFAIFQLFQLLPIFTWLQNPSAVNAGMVIMAAVKVTIMLILVGLFFGLRSLINWLHSRKNGTPHPSLLSAWAI